MLGSAKGARPIRRRDFITIFGGAASAWPIAARAQQLAPEIGWLSLNSAESQSAILKAFRQGLTEAGYVEGQNIKIDWPPRRRLKRFPVFSGGNDPVKLGLVASLNRPGANFTGVINLNIELEPKRLELLHEMLPIATDVTDLVNPTNASFKMIMNDLRDTARRLALRLHLLQATNSSEIDLAFADIARDHPTSLVIAPDAFYMSQSAKLGGLTVRNAVPAIFQTQEFVAAGGHASYATSRTEPYRIAADYAARILKGTKPRDLPVQRPAKVELLINLKTAKALSLTVPPTRLATADG